VRPGLGTNDMILNNIPAKNVAKCGKNVAKIWQKYGKNGANLHK
jgi:hypothetical protein